MLQRLNTTKTKETDALDDVGKMAYKVNEILLMAKKQFGHEEWGWTKHFCHQIYNETN